MPAAAAPAIVHAEPEEHVAPPEPIRHEEHHEEPVEPIHEEWPQAPQAEIGYRVHDEDHRLTEVAAETAAALPKADFDAEPLRADGGGHFEQTWAEPAVPVVDSRSELERSWPREPVVASVQRNAAVEAHDPLAILDDHVAPLQVPSQKPVAAKAAAEPFAWDADAFDELPPIPPAKKPAEPVAMGDFDDVDLFADVHNSPIKPVVKTDAAADDGWRELKELAGYDKFAADDKSAASSIPPDLDKVTISKLQGKSYRIEPKRRRFGIKGILLTLIGLAIVGGAGYAAWLNRTAIDGMVAGLISSAPKTAAVVDNKAPAAPANNAAKAPVAPAATNTAAATKPAATNTNVASLDSDNTVNTKFTQRLMANGTELDQGPAPALDQQSPAAEGKSVAEQNVAAAPPPPAAAQPNAAQQPAQQPAPAQPSAAPAAPAVQPQSNAAPTTPAAAAQPPVTNGIAAAPAAAATGDTASAQPATAPVGSEKMFLYEERLGQSSPTAIEGSVTWSLQQEKGPDGRPEPSVQGNISVPERGLTAMITFKRNSDPSLPASHLVELVFSVPPNFEGGSIDSVQRIAMKNTEQDRGDPLVAVPAKITDDFHMVALNDFPDARKTNLDLLRNRDWIDIPVTYRNGRRALLTMEKGQTGTDAFNKAITAWAALGDVSSSQ
jgi:hypothetical protein